MQRYMVKVDVDIINLIWMTSTNIRLHVNNTTSPITNTIMTSVTTSIANTTANSKNTISNSITSSITRHLLKTTRTTRHIQTRSTTSPIITTSKVRFMPMSIKQRVNMSVPIMKSNMSDIQTFPAALAACLAGTARRLVVAVYVDGQLAAGSLAALLPATKRRSGSSGGQTSERIHTFAAQRWRAAHNI
mmetsp:Transcript_52195/g.121842  ORF Transcript_52195/g.121842 Transcript_52195/m.121842 type:complete len:189 (+) Transcript_52195:656-1222(+)